MIEVTKKITVRYQETDQMGVVYHANYLIWFEIGRTAFIEALGFSYYDMEQTGVVSPVTHIEADYHYPAKYGTPCFITTKVSHYDGLRTRYQYEVKDEKERVLVTGLSDHVLVKKETFKPVSVRKHFPDWHEAYLKATSFDPS